MLCARLQWYMLDIPGSQSSHSGMRPAFCSPGSIVKAKLGNGDVGWVDGQQQGSLSPQPDKPLIAALSPTFPIGCPDSQLRGERDSCSRRPTGKGGSPWRLSCPLK